MLLKKRKRESSKQNINSRKYGQVKLRASKRGVYSCLFALAGAFVQMCLIYVAYRSYGEASAIVGSLGLITLLVAGLGVFYGVNGFREREKSYRSCKIGIVLNGLVIMGFIFLFVRGFGL